MSKKRTSIAILLINVFLGILFLKVFYNMAMWERGDVTQHIEFALQLSDFGKVAFNEFYKSIKLKHVLSYPLWHIIFLGFRGLFSPLKDLLQELNLQYLQVVAAIEITIFMLINYNLYRIFLQKVLINKSTFRDCFLALALVFTGPYMIPTTNSYYLGKGIITPWHNPTTISVQGISILCFYLFYKAFEAYEENNNKTTNLNLVKMSSLLLLSALLKPSFYQMFAPGLFIFCIFFFVLRKGKSFLFCIKTGISLLPVCAMALIQIMLSIDGSGNSIGLKYMKVLNIYTKHPYLSLIAMLMFPLSILCIAIITKTFNFKLGMGIAFLSSGLSQYLFFYLKEGTSAADFAWGFYLSLQLLFFSCIIFLLNNKNQINLLFTKIGWIIYIPHYLCGFMYFLCLLNSEFEVFGQISINSIITIF